MPLLFLLSLEASRRRANYGDQHNCYWMFMALMLLNAGLITYMGTLTNFVGAKYQNFHTGSSNNNSAQPNKNASETEGVVGIHANFFGVRDGAKIPQTTIRMSHHR